MFRRLTLGLIIILLLAACGGKGKTAVPTDTSIAIPEATTLPEATFTPPAASSAATATETPVGVTKNFTPLVGNNAPQGATSTVTPTLKPPPVVLGPENFPADVDPLTGLVVADPKLLERRPIAIKVNVVPRTSNRPPWGLSFADIVYDYYHNDGYSRFHAIFYGQDAELVGPIRSGRLLDSDLIRMYQSIFAYGSADSRINQRFFNAEYADRLILEGATKTCPPSNAIPLCRFDPGGYDHLLGSTAALSQFATDRNVANGKQNLNGMTFSTGTPSNGTTGSQLFVRYSGDNYARWDYDAATGKYLRFQDDVFDQGQGESYAALIDRLNNQQISAANVVVILVPHVYFTPPPGEIVEILLSGTGKAYAFRDGQMFEVTWNRPTNNSVLYLTFADGTQYPFKPGNTWVQVITNTSPVTSQDGGVWRFVFRFP
jgi:PPE-repeat protein